MTDTSKSSRSLAAQLLMRTAEVFQTIAAAILGNEKADGEWQWALVQEAVAISIIRRQSKDDLLKQVAERYDALLAARDKFNETSPYPVCPGCGMRHAPHDSEERAETTH